MIMSYDNDSIIEELNLLRSRAERTAESFRLEKEELLISGDLDDLLRLREMSRTIYTPSLQRLSREVQRLKHLIPADSPRMEEAEEAAAELTVHINRILAHVVSTPNRLIRASRGGALERLRELDAMEDPNRGDI